MYPSLILQHKFYPPHLGEAFLDVYGKIKTERMEAKHSGNKIVNETFKLALNGLSGNLQNEYSWCYSPLTVMQIRINGQLMLLMLAEKLISMGCRILNANTDGVYVLRSTEPEKQLQFEKICKEWETLTKLDLEEEQFEAMYQFAINDYLTVGKGYSETKESRKLKKKGLFIDSVKLGKGMAPMIIPKAINAYFADGIPIEETIYNSKDLNDFLTYQKVSKEYSVEYNTELIQRINRYYMSTDGPYLYKCKVKNGKRDRYIKLSTSSGVTIVNQMLEEFPSNINYRYYIKEAGKIIQQFEIQQQSLF